MYTTGYYVGDVVHDCLPLAFDLLFYDLLWVYHYLRKRKGTTICTYMHAVTAYHANALLIHSMYKVVYYKASVNGPYPCTYCTW
jgi:hypothetical protein